jgi:hypothetical protein
MSKKTQAKRYHEFVFADGTKLISFYPVTRRTARAIHLASDAAIARAIRWKS